MDPDFYPASGVLLVVDKPRCVLWTTVHIVDLCAGGSIESRGHPHVFRTIRSLNTALEEPYPPVRIMRLPHEATNRTIPRPTGHNSCADLELRVRAGSSPALSLRFYVR